MLNELVMWWWRQILTLLPAGRHDDAPRGGQEHGGAAAQRGDGNLLAQEMAVIGVIILAVRSELHGGRSGLRV